MNNIRNRLYFAFEALRKGEEVADLRSIINDAMSEINYLDHRTSKVDFDNDQLHRTMGMYCGQWRYANGPTEVCAHPCITFTDSHGDPRVIAEVTKIRDLKMLSELTASANLGAHLITIAKDSVGRSDNDAS